MSSLKYPVGITLVACLSGFGYVTGDENLPTKFSNVGGIANTRHNLTQSTIGGAAAVMNPYRNNYGEICVYCHTPHGANSKLDAPLWNRTAQVTTYTTYDALGTSTLTQTITSPGVNSLTCLSCHDGTLAVDSIINMPGSGRYLADQQNSQNISFLNSWNNASGADAKVHYGLNDTAPGDGCLVCHSSSAGVEGAGATDFTAFALGRDLTNDHPVGISYPSPGPSVDFNPLTGTKGNVAFFDSDGDNTPDSDEIRVFDSGEGFEVECASCHDPHGVPSAGEGSVLLPSFLRVRNENSTVCLTCHTK